MRFEWDERKRLGNIDKHGLDFRDAFILFEAPHVIVPSRQSVPEPRLLAIGAIEGRIVTAVFTLRGANRRIISLRSARDDERRHYLQLLG